MTQSLWSAIEEHAERTTLTNLASQGRSSPECDLSPRYILGINASRWIYDSRGMYRIRKSKEHTLELEIPFQRLGALLEAPVIPFFVFDASDRPETRLGMALKTDTVKATTGLRQLITAFGYPWHNAPGLAEAELARLNAENVIDAVVSEDGRAILFGARTVIHDRDRGWFGDIYLRDIAVYRVPSRVDDSLLLPSRGSLLLHSLLAGLDRFPAEVSVALASDSLGDNFLDAVTSLRGKARDLRLRVLRKDLRAAAIRLRTPVSACQAHRIVKVVVPSTFPYVPRSVFRQNEYIEDIEAFSAPLTSWSSEDKAEIPTRDAVVLSPPDLTLLTLHCERLLGWDREDRVCSQFRYWIWDGVFSRELQACARAGGGAAAQNDISSTVVKIIGKGKRPTTAFVVRFDPSRRAAFPVLYDPSRYAAITRSALLSLRPVSESSPIAAAALDEDQPSSASQEVTLQGVWVPAPVLKRACPALVDRYERAV